MRLPYPYAERTVMSPRPAALINARPVGLAGSLFWMLMITSVARGAWSDDSPIPDAPTLGLIIPSKPGTAEIATVEAAIAPRIGRLLANMLERVLAVLRDPLGL